MSRIPTPATIEAAPAAAQPLLQAVKKQLGMAPNLFRLVSNSPAALEGYLGLSGALAKGELPAATRERIALAVAEINGCDYCLSAHTYLGRNVAKLDEAEIAANRRGRSNDAKADAAVRFAVQVTERRGTHCTGGLRGSEGGRLHRRPDRRDRPACRPQHLDQLHQHGRADADRLSGGHGQQGRLSRSNSMSAFYPSDIAFTPAVKAIQGAHGLTRRLCTHGGRRILGNAHHAGVA